MKTRSKKVKKNMAMNTKNFKMKHKTLKVKWKKKIMTTTTVIRKISMRKNQKKGILQNHVDLQGEETYQRDLEYITYICITSKINKKTTASKVHRSWRK